MSENGSTSVAAIDEDFNQLFTAGGFLITVIAFLYTMVKSGLLVEGLTALSVLLACFILYLLYRTNRRREARIDQLESRLDIGFGEIIAATDGADASEYEKRTDGGSGWQIVEGVDPGEVEYSAIPSMAGAAAGGAVGATFGPWGAALGALAGALVGGGKAYADLQEDKQRKLDEVALAALQQATNQPGWEYQQQDVRDETQGMNDYWHYEYARESARGRHRTHHIRIRKKDGRIEYRGGPDGQTRLQ